MNPVKFALEAAESGPFDIGDGVSVTVHPSLKYLEIDSDCCEISLSPEAAVELYFHLQKLTADFRRDPP